MPEKKTAAPPAEPELAAARIDQLIDSIESVYHSLTGSVPSAAAELGATIPVERDPVDFVGEQLDRLRVALSPRPAASSPRHARPWSPPLAAWESDRELVLCFDLAGVRREDVEVTLQRDLLTVRGQLSPRADELRLHSSERPLGAFERHVILPQRVVGSVPSAVLRAGELELRLKKAGGEADERQRIEIA